MIGLIGNQKKKKKIRHKNPAGTFGEIEKKKKFHTTYNVRVKMWVQIKSLLFNRQH